MKPSRAFHSPQWLVLLLALFALSGRATTYYVNQNNPNPVYPYTSWATAATNIQDAASRANSGDTVLVTNGIYQYGGLYGGNYSPSSNRVYVANNNVTVQSVNGPAVTTIVGYQLPGTTNGANAVRCVYLSSGSTLLGFTLTNGATQFGPGYGGGIDCYSTNCTVTNCVIIGNVCADGGGGAYSGTLINCELIDNAAIALNNGIGGGAYGSTLINCLLAGNFGSYYGGGTYACYYLINCTVVSNTAAADGGGIDGGTVENSIVYYNFSYNNTPDVGGGNFTNCCAYPAVSGGANNITNAPLFANPAAGNYQLSSSSPCINTGNNSFVTISNDLAGNPRVAYGIVDIGAYESQYNTTNFHYVSLASANPVSPFNGWAIAATNIQNAIDAAKTNDFIVVTDGVYQYGGRSVDLNITNRVALTRAVTVQSVNGPAITIITGTNLPQGIRCAYLTNGATLSGFTLTAGSSWASGDPNKDMSGGGVWCASSSSIVTNCILTANYAYNNGGAGYQGTLINCLITSNQAANGGGAYDSTLTICVISNNTAGSGGGLYGCIAYNSLISSNLVYGGDGGGADSSSLSNCVLQGNYAPGGGGAFGSTLLKCTVAGNTAGNQGGGISLGNATNCMLENNSAGNGGGAANGILYSCILYSNTASEDGGGTAWSALYNCNVISNTAGGFGGGVYASVFPGSTAISNSVLSANLATYGGGAVGGELFYCTLTNNTATYGGGVFDGQLYNCLVADNTATYGGGARSGALINCILAGNSAVQDGGGADYDATLRNCTVINNSSSVGGGLDNAYAFNSILYYNAGGDYDPSSEEYYCCTALAPTNGSGNITNNPAFVNLAGGNYHLQSTSPCINSGNNAYVTSATDLDGNPRIVGGTVDIGAYEYQTPTSVISYAYLQQYGLPTDGSADYANLDGTAFNVYQDWVAGLNPTNSTSVLAMLTPAATINTNGITVIWQSVSGISYNLMRSTNLPAFTTLQANIPGQPGTTSYKDTTATNEIPYFYRVGVLAP